MSTPVKTKFKILNPKSVRYVDTKLKDIDGESVPVTDVTVNLDVLGDGSKKVKGKRIRVIELDIDDNVISDQTFEPTRK